MMRPAGGEQALLVEPLSFAHMLLAAYLHGLAVADGLVPPPPRASDGGIIEYRCSVVWVPVMQQATVLQCADDHNSSPRPYHLVANWNGRLDAGHPGRWVAVRICRTGRSANAICPARDLSTAARLAGWSRWCGAAGRPCRRRPTRRTRRSEVGRWWCSAPTATRPPRSTLNARAALDWRLHPRAEMRCRSNGRARGKPNRARGRGLRNRH